ncbi:hypothetical protein Csp1_01560 [Corynebacterium provencense]|uniref:Uncharacterized protein n=1 Tax=Corynebacterium provencense TaxID=1737425 RepID=A0A2Z3YR67_9CORY|nr:hypothetical protein [Corynebacterium provencense]AWT24984.1 hypothetical protein Csp1_01560 [Corynebacterium provencense]
MSRSPFTAPLPKDLADRVRAWARAFHEHFEPGTGWPTKQMARDHQEEGRRLHAEVAAALPDDTVVLHYWETGYADDPEAADG